MSIRWGVVGAGGIANRRTIPEGILPAANSELMAVMDTSEQVAMAVGEKYGARAYANSSELYRDPEVDAVYIAIPTHLHAHEVFKAAEHGKHILCEKPMALSVQEAERMIAMCAEAKVKLGVGFMMRFHPHHLKLKQLIDQGALGTPVMGRAQLTCWYPAIEGAWRQDPKRGGGGSFADMGTHCLDVLELLLGKVTEVCCYAENLVQDYLVEDSSVVMTRHASGAIGMVDNHFNIPDAASLNVLEIHGSRGTVLCTGTIGQDSSGNMIARLEEEPGEYDAQQQREEDEDDITAKVLFPEHQQNIYQAEIEAFAAAIGTNSPPPVSGEDGLWSMKVMEAVYRSARSRQVVDLDEG